MFLGGKKKQYRSISNSVHIRHKRDFDWRPARRNSIKIRSVDRVSKPARLRWLILFLFISFFGTLYILFFHSTFMISEVDATGLKRIDVNEFNSVVLGIMDSHHWKILSNKNYFLLDVDELTDILKKRFPIVNISVEKEFPKGLHFSVQEKSATIIFDNGEQYAYVDEDGVVVEILKNVTSEEWVYHETSVVASSTSSSTLLENTTFDKQGIHTPKYTAIAKEFGQFPIVYSTFTTSTKKDAVVLDKDIVNGILYWYKQMQNANIPWRYAEINDQFGLATIKTGEGWYILASLSEKLAESQFNALLTVLNSKEVSRSALQYIDVRYQNRIYWK